MSDYVWFEGIPFPPIESQIVEEVRHKFPFRDDDTIIVTYPKSGTHWMIEIVSLIQTKGNPEWVQSVPIWKRSPWIEYELGYKILINKEGPHLITSHLPFHLFPRSFFSSKAKMIYVIRNPRDVLVSGYYFWSKSNFAKIPDSMTTYVDWFLKGNVHKGAGLSIGVNKAWHIKFNPLAMWLCVDYDDTELHDGVSGITVAKGNLDVNGPCYHKRSWSKTMYNPMVCADTEYKFQERLFAVVMITAVSPLKKKTRKLL
ncbi:sulfotransferase 2A1-like [Mesocricetus auratus]|uniref:Sulfotransferase n=1 Tax=Mesocricetus auratus TaxID=10036 RepID=A0ABM2WH51_MESAU|nr:sulfotransferase 2A1-like [Mesocricetus auratus]